MSSRLRVFVEGETDEPFARRVVEAAGHSVDAVFPMHGHGEIDKRVDRWCKPANTRPMLILRDLHPALGKGCASALVRHLVGTGPHSATTVFRIAERELEAWLLADRKAVAAYFQVRPVAVPVSPDMQLDPKQTLVNVCRSSSSSSAQQKGMVPSSLSLLKGWTTVHWACVDIRQIPLGCYACADRVAQPRSRDRRPRALAMRMCLGRNASRPGAIGFDVPLDSRNYRADLVEPLPSTIAGAWDHAPLAPALDERGVPTSSHGAIAFGWQAPFAARQLRLGIDCFSATAA